MTSNREQKIIVSENWKKVRPNSRFYNKQERETTLGELIDSGKMYIVLKETAGSDYLNNERVPNYDWATNLEELEGMALEVETDCLFTNQYNTEKLRIMDESISMVINDKRKGMYKCQYCGNIQDFNNACTKCAESDYMHSLYIEEVPYERV